MSKEDHVRLYLFYWKVCC